jgi:hypothetical protein
MHDAAVATDQPVHCSMVAASTDLYAQHGGGAQSYDDRTNVGDGNKRKGD